MAKNNLIEKLEKIGVSSGWLQNKFDKDIQREIPKRAKDRETVKKTEEILKRLPTTHKLILGDSRDLSFVEGEVHLIVTSPPYWTIKKYAPQEGQLGVIKDYECSTLS